MAVVYRGWRSRLGVLVPSPNPVLELDVLSLLPEGVSAHFTRVGLEGQLSLDLLESMVGEALHESRKLALAGVSVLGYGCTSGSFFKGHGFDEEIIRRLKESAGNIPATTATTAAVAALTELGMKKIAFCSPYEREIHEKGVAYLESYGFEVVSGACLGLKGGDEIGLVPAREIGKLVRRAEHSRAEAIFISCTGFPALHCLGPLERDLRKPVLSSNLTFTWHMLKLAGVSDPLPGFGDLLARRKELM